MRGCWQNHGQLPSRYTTEENVLSSYINHWRGRSSWTSPLSMTGCWQAHSSRDCVHLVTAAMGSKEQLALPCLESYSLGSLFRAVPWDLGGDVDVLCMTAHSQHFDQYESVQSPPTTVKRSFSIRKPAAEFLLGHFKNILRTVRSDLKPHITWPSQQLSGMWRYVLHLSALILNII